jgi:TonB-dependent starch-binding outer membrane protein SusC
MIRTLRLVAILLVMAGVTAPAAFGQATGVVTGVVIDGATRQPLSGAQVTVVGTTVGNVTDPQGRYLLRNVPVGQQVIRLVLIGYSGDDVPVTVVAGQTVVADVTARVSAVALDEVVVSAITGRAERKRELGTNTARIDFREIERAPITRMADVLVGRAAGVQMQIVSGSVGTSQRIRIRGANSISLSNEPLIFVDGIAFSNNKGGFGVGGADYSRLNDINSEDIANIEILKGPAASALYGTAAANGVVLITTKRGQAGTARWRAYVETGTSEDRSPYPMNYMAVQANATGDMFTGTGTLNRTAYRFCPNEDAARGICRQDQVVAMNPFATSQLTPFVKGDRQQFGMSVSGGTDVVTYFVSGDFSDEQGVVSFNTQDRMALRTNMNARARANLALGISASYTRTKLALNQNDNNIFSPLINGLLASPWIPTAEQRLNSSPGSRPGTGFGYYMSDIENLLSLQTVDRYIVGGNSSWQPIPWLSLNANVGLDYFGRFDQQTLQPGRLPIAATYTPGFREGQRANNYVWTLGGAAVATRDLMSELRSTTTLGAGFSREQFESVYCYGVGIVEGTRSCTATSSLFSVSEGYSQIRTVGAYLSEQLAWRDRVFVAGSIRGDDNSAFGQDFGFIYYPGASLSWVVSEEPFFPQVGFLSSLRLRTAYGRSGQRPNFRDAITLLGPVSATVGNQELSAVRLSSVGNPELKPERTTEYEMGFDAAFLNERVSVEFGYFNKKSYDALVARPLPPSYGLHGDGGGGLIWDNLGSIKNWGTELGVSARVLQTPRVALDMRLSATTLDNRIEDLGENIQPITLNRGSVQMHKQGFPTGAFHGRRYEIKDPHVQRLLTRDDVILVDVDSVTFLGRQLPTNTQALSGELSLFRNLITISGLFERRAGMYMLNDTERFRCTTGYSRGNAGTSQGMGQCDGVANPAASLEEQARFIAMRLGAVDPTSPNPANPRRVTSLTGYLEKADFIKWRELSVRLNAPEQLAQLSPLLRGASFTVSGRNLATWTDYTGLDPEINESGGSSNFNQGEFNTQPPLRYFTFRLNFNF